MRVLKDVNDIQEVRTSASRQLELFNIGKEISTAKEIGIQDIALAPRLFLWGCLPYVEPKQQHLYAENTWVRSNGQTSLRVVCDPAKGMPFGGYPRIYMIYVADTAIKQKTTELHLGDSISDLMHTLNMKVSFGKTGSATAFTRQIDRLLYSTFFINDLTKSDDAELRTEKRIQIMNGRLTRQEKKPGSRIDQTLVLDPSFYQQVIKEHIPVHWDVVRALVDVPMTLDLYQFATNRAFSLNKEYIDIPYKALMYQFGSVAKYPSQFIREFKRSFAYLLNIYPEFNAQLLPNHLRVYKSLTSVVPKYSLSNLQYSVRSEK